MSITIIPSDLASTKSEFDRRLASLLPVSSTIHLDLMDGRFVETRSIDPEQLPDLRRWKGKRFEAHLMLKEPMRVIAPLVQKGVRRIILHYESVWPEDLPAIARFIRKWKGVPVLAVNPDTPIKRVLPYVQHFDTVLLMGVHPGRNGAPYISDTPKRVRELAKHHRKIQVDGGMTLDTVKAVVAAGATRITSGSYVSNAKDPKKAMAELRAAAKR